MINFVFSIVLVSLVASCSTSNKIAFVSKKKFEKEKVVVTDNGVKPFLINDCAAGVIVIPINTFIDFEEALEKQCGKEWSIFDFEETITIFKIPILYGQACKEIKGRCKKSY